MRNLLWHRPRMGRSSAQLLKGVRVATALVLASGVASFVYALLSANTRLFPPAFAFFLAVAVMLGLPAYLVARATRRDTPLVAAVTGFVLGAAIPAALVLVGRPDEASVGGVATVVHGSYTTTGWLQAIEFVGLFGLLGGAAALVFLLIVRSSARPDDNGRIRQRNLGTILSAIGAAVVIAGAFSIPYATADRSCHNPLRGGRTSIEPVASFRLRVGVDQWSSVGREVEEFGQAGSWSARPDVRTDPSFPWLQISLCKEPGTNIMVQGLPETTEVDFSVYQPQGGAGWRREFRALYDRFKARWPTKIAFDDSQGSPASTPEWAADKPSN